MFFVVKSLHSVPELVKQQLEFIQKYEIGITTKDTQLEYTRKISLVLRVNLQFTSTL